MFVTFPKGSPRAMTSVSDTSLGSFLMCRTLEGGVLYADAVREKAPSLVKSTRGSASTVQEPGNSRPKFLMHQKFLRSSKFGLGAAYWTSYPCTLHGKQRAMTLEFGPTRKESCFSKIRSETGSNCTMYAQCKK